MLELDSPTVQYHRLYAEEQIFIEECDYFIHKLQYVHIFVLYCSNRSVRYHSTMCDCLILKEFKGLLLALFYFKSCSFFMFKLSVPFVPFR